MPRTPRNRPGTPARQIDAALRDQLHPGAPPGSELIGKHTQTSYKVKGPIQGLIDGDEQEPWDRNTQLPPNWHDWAAVFLETLRTCGTVRYACAAAGISRDTAYKSRELHPDFAALWDEAAEDAVDILQATAYKIATEDQNPIMIMFLLKCLRPSVFRDTQKIEMVQEVDVTRLSERQLVALIETGRTDGIDTNQAPDGSPAE